MALSLEIERLWRDRLRGECPGQLSYVGTARMVSLWLPWLLIALLRGGAPFAYLRGPC
jgi:hypothetical protein